MNNEVKELIELLVALAEDMDHASNMIKQKLNSFIYNLSQQVPVENPTSQVTTETTSETQ